MTSIGINVGDVMAEGADLYGDGVNIAARIEGLCAPGSILLSDTAHAQVRDRLEHDWTDAGEHEVKLASMSGATNLSTCVFLSISMRLNSYGCVSRWKESTMSGTR